MKHSHTHNRFPSRSFSLKEGRLIYEWDASAETHSVSSEEAEEQLNKDIKTYVRREMNDKNIPDDDKDARATFLRELSSAEAGIMKFEQKFNIKFGRDDAGDLVVLSKKHELLEKLLQPSNEGGGALDNGDSTYTISTMSGSRKLSLVIDDMMYETLRGHASVTVDNLPPIARKNIPPTEPQRTAYINQYALDAVKTPALLNLSGKTVADFGVGNYERMVDSVVLRRPEAIQYVMVEWALGNKNRYDFLWNSAIEKNPTLLEHLTSNDKIDLVLDYPLLCRKAVEKNPASVRFVRFDKIPNERDKKFIVSIAVNAGAEIKKMLPTAELKKFAGQLQLNKLVAKEASATPTLEDIEGFQNALLSTEFSGDLNALRSFIEMRPRLIHFVSPEWIPAHTDEYKELWIKAVHVYPDVIAMPETLAALKQHYGANAFGFYTDLVKSAVAEHMVGQRPEDASYLPLHVDPEWRKERPDDFRELFIIKDTTVGSTINNTPNGEYSLLMLLRVEGAEEAFNNTKAGKNLLGYPTALYTAMNEENLANVIRAGQSELITLKKHLNKLRNLQARYDEVLQQTLIKYPELQNEFTFANKDVLKAKFNNRQTIVTALATGRNIFMGLDVKDVQAFKSNVFKVLKDPTEQPENLAALFTYMPPEWKTTSADLKELVSANASLYKFVNPDKSIDLSKIDLSIFKAALQAHIDKKGALDWLNDVPKSIRDRMGDAVPTDPSIDALVIKEEKPVEHKSAVEDMSDPAIAKLTAQEVFALMRNPNEKPASVFALLVKKQAPIVNDVRFLRDAMNIYTDVYTFVLEDASAADLRKKTEVEKYIVDKIEQALAQFIVLPDALKTQTVYLKAALKKYSAGDILRRSVFKTDKAFADAMNAEFATLSNLDKKIVAYGCTQNHLVAFADATRAEVLQHNISLALEEMTQEQRAAKVKEILTQEVSPERNADIQLFMRNLEIEHVAKLVDEDVSFFDFLSSAQKTFAQVLEIVAKKKNANGMLTLEMENALENYFLAGRHEKDDRKKYPQLAALYDARLENILEENPEYETLKTEAQQKQWEFEVYGDKAVELESTAELKKNMLGWKGFATSGQLQKDYFNESEVPKLRDVVRGMKMRLNSSALIVTGRLEWTDAELKAIDDKNVPFLIVEMNQRITQIGKKLNPEHHQKNIELIFNRLKTISVEKVTADLVTVLNTVPTRSLPGSLQAKMSALKEKWERAARDNYKKKEDLEKRAKKI